jgi:hypothetical protein
MNKKITNTAITSIIPLAMICIGFGITFIPPVVLGILGWNDQRVIEEAMSSPLTVSTLPTLSTALLILGSIGLAVHGLLKNKLALLRQR